MPRKGTERVQFGETELEVPRDVLSTPAVDLAAYRARRKALSEPGGRVRGQMATLLADLRGDNSMKKETLDFLQGLEMLLPELTWTQLWDALWEMRGVSLNLEAVPLVPIKAT